MKKTLITEIILCLYHMYFGRTTDHMVTSLNFYNVFQTHSEFVWFVKNFWECHSISKIFVIYEYSKRILDSWTSGKTIKFVIILLHSWNIRLITADVRRKISQRLENYCSFCIFYTLYADNFAKLYRKLLKFW